MSTTFFCRLALTAVPVATPAATEPDRVERAIRKLRQELMSAVNAGDLGRAMACWSADVRIMVEGRPPIEGPAAREAARPQISSTVRLARRSAPTDHSPNLAYD